MEIITNITTRCHYLNRNYYYDEPFIEGTLCLLKYVIYGVQEKKTSKQLTIDISSVKLHLISVVKKEKTTQLSLL